MIGATVGWPSFLLLALPDTNSAAWSSSVVFGAYFSEDGDDAVDAVGWPPSLPHAELAF